MEIPQKKRKNIKEQKAPWPPDPGGVEGYNHSTTTAKTCGDLEAERAKELAENKGSSAKSTYLNSLIPNDSARALASAPALKIATASLWPPDPG